MPLNLARSFTMADDHDEMAHFLHTTGYLVIRSVFSADEVGALNALVAAEKATAASGDNRSWWATDAEGHEVCCRLTYLGLRRDEFARLANDPRLRDIVALTDIDMLPCTDRLDGMSVVIKNPAIVSGLSDLPWHRDCAMGGHFVLCPGLNIGIQLDAADADNGQLWYLAGSHRHAAQALRWEIEGLGGCDRHAAGRCHGALLVSVHAAPPPRSPTAAQGANVGGHIAEHRHHRPEGRTTRLVSKRWAASLGEESRCL